MKTIEHEGAVYVLKSDMESAIQSRIQKIAHKAAEAEQRATELQSALDEASASRGSIDALASQLEQAQAQLAQANARYERHSTIAKYGLTDKDMLDAVEWQYERAMSGRAKKDLLSLGDWLDECVSAPEQAPALLRPHLQAIAPAQPQAIDASQVQALGRQMTQATPAQPQAMPTPPAMNTNAQSAPVRVDDVLSRGLNDFEFYKQNRDNVIAAYRNRNKHGV
jgi:hypothetical protein